MKKYNVTTVGTYHKNGEEKKTYPQVGKLIQFDATGEKPEGFILELNMFPGTRFCVFLDEPREGQAQNRPAQTKAKSTEAPLETIEYPEESTNLDDIPF